MLIKVLACLGVMSTSMKSHGVSFSNFFLLVFLFVQQFDIMAPNFYNAAQITKPKA